MEKYLGYSAKTIRRMIVERQTSLNDAIVEMLQFPKDGLLYRRAESQARELADLINEWTFRCDEKITE